MDSSNVPRSAKGYIVATRLVTDADPTKNRTTSYIEDPNTEGEPLSEQDRSMLGRGAIAVHYARVFGKLGLLPVASALNLGYALPRQLTFQLPVWTCTSPPFQGRKYIGGYYQTVAGYTPTYTERGWQLSLELGAGHSVFIGLDADIASRVAQAARGEWEVLNAIKPVVPEGTWSSEFAWLFDGTVAAPLLYFIPTQVMIL